MPFSDVPSIEAVKLSKRYGSFTAVSELNLKIEGAKCVGFLGPNGAGKTTAIEIMEGLRKRDEGTIKVLGLDPWSKGTELHKKIGVIPQQFNFFDKTSPKEAINYYASLFGVSVDADEILKEVLLEDSAKNLFENLSGGQKQKMGLALSLVNSPELLFLDEPTTGLDPNARRAIWEVIRKLKAKGKTVILTTHYLEEAQVLADRVAIVDHGKIVAMGTSDEIIEQYGSGERLEIHGTKELAEYVQKNTELTVGYDPKGVISIQLNKKIDALAALAAAEQSGLEWGEIHTRRDSLEDVFVKLVSGAVDDSGEIAAEGTQHKPNNSSKKRRR